VSKWSRLPLKKGRENMYLSSLFKWYNLNVEVLQFNVELAWHRSIVLNRKTSTEARKNRSWAFQALVSLGV
jgi:hypothetical protein